MQTHIEVMLYAVLTFGAATLCATTPTVTLALTPDHALPGVPVAMRLTVTNGSGGVYHLPPVAEITVTPSGGGASFTASTGSNRTDFAYALPGDSRLTFPADDSHEVDIEIDEYFAKPEFFSDSRLFTPGKYSIQLVFDSGTAAAVTSSAATLTVTTPTGADAEVWSSIYDAAQAAEFVLAPLAAGGPFVADDVLANKPTSKYLPYVAVYARVVDATDAVTHFDRAIAVAPPSPALEALQRAKARTLMGLAAIAIGNNDGATAKQYSASAKTLLASLARSSFLFNREASIDAFEELQSAAQIDAIISLKMANAVPQFPVRPSVDCQSDNSDGTFTVHFGYENLAEHARADRTEEQILTGHE